MKRQGKKILVGGLAIILVGGIIASIVYFKQVNESKEDLKNYVEKQQVEEIVEDEINTSIEDSIIEEETKEETNQEVPKENDNNISSSNVGTTSENKESTKETKNTDNNKQNTSKQSLNTKTENKQEVSQPVTTTVVKESKKEEVKVVETPKHEEPKQDVHTYKYNNAIVEKMKQDIKNNESEYMKQYGYNIVVDESIVIETNQFTYTSTRVKDKIVYKFGTIKIYARDYYLNGNYMYTECFLI